MADSSYNFTVIDDNAFAVQDCEHLVKIWHYLKYNQTGDSHNYLEYGNKDDVYNYIVEGFDGYLRSDFLPKPPKTQEFWDWSIQLYQPVTRAGLSECPLQMCKAIGWDGSPDLSGIGMVVTYTTQAILATVYLLSILEIRLNWLPPRIQKWRIVSRTLLAVQHSTAELLSASSIFSLSLLVASIHSVAMKHSINRSIYILVLVVPLNSILPTIILHVAASSMLRRSGGRVFSWLVIELLVIALVILGLTVPRKGDSILADENNLIGYQHPCVPSLFVKTTYFSLFITLILLLGIAAYVLDSLVSMVRHRPGLLGRRSNKLQWVTIVFCLCAMWFFIWWFINLTLEIKSRTGDNNDDIKWTFGQVLALATWAPPILEFAYVWWEEPARALNGRLMGPYEVVKMPPLENFWGVESSRGYEESGFFQ